MLDSRLKGCDFESWEGRQRIFFSRVNFLCWLLFGVHFTPMLQQWLVKDPGHSAKGADGRLHLNTHTPLTQRSQSGLTVPLTRHSVGTYPAMSSQATFQGTWPQSPQLAEPLWTDPGLKSGIRVRKRISTQKKAQAGNEWSNILPKSLQARKKPPSSPINQAKLVLIQERWPWHGNIRGKV